MRALLMAMMLAFVVVAGCVESSPGERGQPTYRDEADVPTPPEPAADPALAPAPEPTAGPIITDPVPPAPADNRTEANGTVDAPPADTPPAASFPHHPNSGAHEVLDIRVASFDDHPIPVSVFKPAIADSETRFPILLHSHGFTGSRWTGTQATDYVAAGFGVVSFDERGHGDAAANSEVKFMHPSAEVQDVLAVIDHIATLDWVLMEAPGDPLLGTIGGSYGGAFQLMGHIFDTADRIDAMVPDITWHNITTALAPNGAIKSGWVDLFYVAGNTISPITFSDDFHVGFAWATSTNELPAGQLPVVPDLVTLFNEASPQSYPGELDIPTLYTQGMGDTLFPLNQAVWNHDATLATGAEARIYSHNGGHILNSESLAGSFDPIPAVGLQGTPGGFPCGDQKDLNIMWHQKWLLGLDVDLGPRYCIALDDDTAVVGDTWPLPSTEMRSIPAGGPFPVVQAVVGTPIPLTTISADEEMVLAGIPRLSGSITSPGSDAIVYFGFYKLDEQGLFEHIVNDQMRPLRIKGPNTGAVDFDIELGGIGTHLMPGDEIVLVASSIEPMYFGNSGRVPAGLVLDDLSLSVPVVTAPVFR